MASGDKPPGKVVKPKWRVSRLLCGALAVIAGVFIGNSYVESLNRDRAAQRAYGPLTRFRVHAGNLTQWPQGKDRHIWFDGGSPRLSDRDADALLGLASPDIKGPYDSTVVTLRNTDLSDQAVPILAGLDGIDMIDVSGSRITEKGAQELRKQMRITRVIGPFPDKVP